MRPVYQVTELLGDGIGPELSNAVHQLADALPVALEFIPVDFSLANRRVRTRAIYDEAVNAITATRMALKHPTTTAEESPNAILRRRLDLSVIHRPVYTIPGVPTNFRRTLDLDIVRVATGGTYDDPGRMIGEDGAVSLRIVERRPVREAARYAFNLARKTAKRVTSSSKYTIQTATDGLFEQVTQEVSHQFPEVVHAVELFDALLGKVIMTPEKFQIVLVLNEYGDFLSDMACGLAGSLGIGASANLGFDSAAVVRVALFDAAHGTAPDIAGKNIANPTAIFLALSLLLYQLGEISIGQAVKNATLDLLRHGTRTRDLGGNESTESFTAAVASEVAARLAPKPRFDRIKRPVEPDGSNTAVSSSFQTSTAKLMLLVVLTAVELVLFQDVWFIVVVPPVTAMMVGLNLGLWFVLLRPRWMETRIIGMLTGSLAATMGNLLYLWLGYSEIRIGRRVQRMGPIGRSWRSRPRRGAPRCPIRAAVWRCSSDSFRTPR